MTLTGIEIFKLLPKTNCKECGVPTCLAFAMNLAAGKAELSACPYVSDEAKEKLAEASAPPIRPVTIGTGESALKVGGETVQFRHEKTFFNKPGFAVLVSTSMSNEEVEERLKRIKELQYERVGLILKADLVAVKDDDGDASSFASLVEKVAGADGFGIILMSERSGVLKTGLERCKERRPLIYGAAKGNATEMAELAKANSCPIVARGNNLDELIETVEALTAAGLKDIVLDSSSRGVRKAVEDQIIIRRAALVDKFKSLGYPTIALPCEMTTDPMKEVLLASLFISKYAGIIVLSNLEGHSLFPLALWRMNVYTDPQRPMATKQGIYEIGNPAPESPVLITTNFSLTYFIVAGEIETSRIPSWLLVMDCEGLSVMTAWAAGKFVGDAAGAFVKKSGIEEKVKHKKLIIPGYSAAILGDLEDELPGWQVLVGPREAAHIPSYLREWKA